VTVALNAALTVNERTRRLLDGSVAPEGVAFNVIPLSPGDMFYRQLKFAEFDVSELSLASLVIATAAGPTPWLALPVFTTREFFHTGILVRADSTLRSPADLKHRRVGVLEYQQTAVVWIRGALQHEFGVRDVDVEWFMERAPERSHGGATGFAPPDGVRLTYVAPETSLGAMLEAGEIDAILFYPSLGDAIDARANGRGNVHARTLFADPASEARRYAAATGLHPLNHCVVVRRSLAQAHPWLAERLYDAFVAANDPAEPFVYGLDATRRELETLVGYLYEQRLIPRVLALDEIFAPAFTTPEGMLR